MECLKKAWKPILKPALRSGESKAERFRKELIIPVFIVSALVSLTWTFQAVPENPLQIILLISTFVIFLGPIVYIYRTRSLTLKATEIMVIAVGIRIPILANFANYGKGEAWSGGVLVMDLMLLLACRERATNTMRNLIVAYLLFQGFLQGFDIGLYDALPALSDQQGRDPDCKHTAMSALSESIIRIFVFATDFAMTSYFSAGMRREKARMEQAVCAAESVASALANFDLDLAEKELRVANTNEGLHLALLTVLNNLRSYRPFLPDVLFKEDTETVMRNFRPPPKGDEVCIVFTDIQSSTSIWNVSQQGMRKALAIHDRILRKAIENFNGYEVKTIGDAFMVAFDCASDAVGFAVEIQEGLYAAQWPSEILQHPLCTPCALWNGLRVRVGIHCGTDLMMQVNPVTGRADYFGSVVNAASRIEGTVTGGLIAMSTEVYKRSRVHVITLPEKDTMLRGFKESVAIITATPPSLCDRLTTSEVDGPVQHEGDSLTYDPTRVIPMRSYPASVAAVRVDYSFVPEEGVHSLVDVVPQVVETATRANGKILSVCSSYIHVTWNVGQPCPGHHTQALRFSAFFARKASSAMWRSSATVGICSGPVIYSQAGTGSKQYILVVGQCIELASALAAAATDAGTVVLATAVPGQRTVADDPSMHAVTRQVDTWTLENGEVKVFEVRTEPLVQTFIGDDGDEEWGWSDAYRQAYAERRTDALRDIDDRVLHRVADLIDTGSHLQRPIPVNTLPFSAALDRHSSESTAFGSESSPSGERFAAW